MVAALLDFPRPLRDGIGVAVPLADVEVTRVHRRVVRLPSVHGEIIELAEE